MSITKREDYTVKLRVRTWTKIPGFSGRITKCYSVSPVAVHITFEELLLRVRRDDPPYRCKKIVVYSARGEFLVCSDDPLSARLGDFVYDKEEIIYFLDIIQATTTVPTAPPRLYQQQQQCPRHPDCSRPMLPLAPMLLLPPTAAPTSIEGGIEE
ncbi:2208_t:CDS:2 [Paraglomus brasilianum]|uniref:2208_t:CDS:1 n=1 Tax=Paraglomus brasilianum TaxID=144538 RepID=A0A9N9B9C6_9GLOM|nr:2208_t:CDS:2 [Paraglomus brasilianum]